MNPSVRNALAGMWFLLFATCVGLAFFLLNLYQQSTDTQLRQTENIVQQAADSTLNRYQTYVANSEVGQSSKNSPEEVRELNLLLSLVLAQFDGVEGGFWHPEAGFESYAFPTYGGADVRKDFPSTEISTIKGVVQDALKMKHPSIAHFDRQHRTLVICARPIEAQEHYVLWTMAWCDKKDFGLLGQVAVALTLLFLCSLLSGIWLTRFLYQWTAKVTALESTISATAIEDLPQLAMTGQKELDRVVIALNQLNGRLKESRAASAKLTKELARADKLSGLGRMLAGFAHEIRNPLATIRLSAENALEVDATSQERLLRGILQESIQLEGLLQKLLSVAKLHELKPEILDLKAWLDAQVEPCQILAGKKGVAITVEAPGEKWSFDSESLGRAIYNVILNAIENTPASGWVIVEASIEDANCKIVVEDSGPGILEADRELIFEPLVTRRPSGVGLGLTIVREIIEAHGGTICCLAGKEGARFEMEIPWLKSSS